ncbi:hypothetical protein IAR50_003782 [Cryptococcus sp. DSM 104548]
MGIIISLFRPAPLPKPPPISHPHPLAAQPHPLPRSPRPRTTKNGRTTVGKGSTRGNTRPLSPGLGNQLRPYTPIAQVVHAPEPVYCYQSLRSQPSPLRGTRTARARRLRAASLYDDDDDGGGARGGGSRASNEGSLRLPGESEARGSRGKNGSLSPMGFASHLGLGIGLGGLEKRPWDRLANDEMSDDTLSAPSSPAIHSPSPFDSPPSLSIPTQYSSHSSTPVPVAHSAPPPSSFPAFFPEPRRRPEPSTSTADSSAIASSHRSSSEEAGAKGDRSFAPRLKRVEGGWDMVREGDWDTG